MESTSEFDDDDDDDKNKDCFDDGEFKPMVDIDPGEVSDDYNKIEQDDISNVKCTSMDTFKIVLKSIKHNPVKFATNGITDKIHLPSLNIKGFGPISLPLCESQGREIIDQFERNSIDSSVKIKNILEFYPDDFTITNPKFHRILQSIRQQVKSEMFVNLHVNLTLKKLVICGKGSRFVTSSNIGEEEFVTIIVQLPSLFTGNKLTVSIGDETEIVAFDGKEAHCEIIYSAFYSNCNYEMTPLESGYRVALIYKLKLNDSKEMIKPLEESIRIRKEVTTALSEIYRNRKKRFALLLEEKYNWKSLKSGVKKLKSQDQAIGDYLEYANKSLPLHEQWSFYLVDYQTSADGLSECSKDDISLQKGIKMDGSMKSVDFLGLSLDKNEDIIAISEIQKYKQKNDKEKEKARRKLRFLILAIPSIRQFEYFCSSKFPTQCLQYMADKVDHTSPQFKVYLKDLFKRYKSFNESNSKLLVNLIIKPEDPEIVLWYIEKVMARKFNYSEKVHGIPDIAEVDIAKIFKSVPWEQIKEAVENVIENVEFWQYEKWMMVFYHSGIIDVAHRVVYSSLQEIKSRKRAKRYMRPLWQEIIESLHKHDNLSERWLDEITTCDYIVNDIELNVLLLNKLLFDKPSYFLLHLNRFVDDIISIDQEEDMRGFYPEEITEMIVSVVRHTFHNYDFFKEPSEKLFDYIVSGSIVLDILLQLSNENDTEGFKMIFDRYIDQLLYCTHLVKDRVTLAQILLRCNITNMNSNIERFLEVCRTIGDLNTLCMIIEDILKNKDKIDNKKRSFEMVNGLLEIFVTNFNMDFNFEKVVNLVITLFSEGDLFASKLDEFFSNEFFLDQLRRRFCRVINGVTKKEFPKCESSKKLLRLLLSILGEELFYYDSYITDRYHLHFVRKLFKDRYFEDIVLEFISSEKFKYSNHEPFPAYKRRSYIEILIDDFKIEFSKNDLYGELLLVRYNNLRTLKERGCPKFTWKQSDAHIYGHPAIERFLRSEEVTLVYRNFNDIDQAVEWLMIHSHWNEDHDFTGIVRGHEGEIELILQKGRDLHERMIVKYTSFMDEMKELETRLKRFPKIYSKMGALKRTSPSSNKNDIVPAKKAHLD
eukprot:TCONS_00067734-protein